MISQVKNLTLSETLTSLACLFKMEFNHGDIFPSTLALFIIFPLSLSRGNSLKSRDVIGWFSLSDGRHAARQVMGPGNKARRGFSHQKLSRVYHPRSSLLSLDVGCKIFTRENWKSRAELWGWDLEEGWARQELLSSGMWSEAVRQGQDLSRLTWENQGMTVYQVGFWHERRDQERAQDTA